MSRALILFVCLIVVLGASSVSYALDSENDLFCVYSDASLEGRRACGSEREINWVGWRWYRNISSLEVKAGYELIAFPFVWQQGQPEVFSGTVTNLGAWNNRISSFYLRPKVTEQAQVCFYSKKNYRGERFCTTDSLYWLGWYWNNRISSVSIPAGYQVKLYNRWGFYGRSVTLTSSTPSLNGVRFNNRTSSFEIGPIDGSSDADNDGIDDSVDICPDTLLGETVDEQGCALSQLDSDNDGVNDDADKCADTPRGETVNAEGCALSQLDTDNDGVNDAIDQCPATPANETPNGEGCAPSQLDADNDGVNDAVDQCPATPAGETPNSEGCAPSQLDEDNDGVNDATDQCPATPTGETPNVEGCAPSQLDADRDGVNDAVDQCPATPVGEQVNAEGCASSQLDSDNDGVNDSADQCPATPEGETANEQGCALTQLDSDNDGANDAVDQCPATPVGEQANAEGCAPSQLDSDNDGVNDANDQCPATPIGETVNDEGCSLTQLDTDNDGANDAVDQCPATPDDETANAEGCAPSQLDSDNDSVNDAVDQCPDTPEGGQANAEGCASSQLDSDSDTVTDDLDQCIDTPAGETVNAEGCAPSQLDSDSDGVNDAIDQCPDTPAGEQANTEGCALSQLDSDNDGANDAIDQCPATPADETANTEGCALSQLDSDNDSVNDAIDQCPNTPAGETLNAEGCAPSQLDSDNDGVNDALDQCPATPAGDTPNAEGCSPDQIDTDGDGTPDYLDAFPNDPNEVSDLDGDGIGDNADTDRDGDGVLNGADAFPDDATESSDLDGDGIGDNTDPDIDGDGVNNDDDYFPNDPDLSSVPTVQITSPATLTTVGSSPLRISGTLDDLNAKLIINGIEVPQNSGSFEADVALEEGANNIIVRAIDSNNNEGTATINVSLDKTPPYITLQSPVDGGKVFTDSISVSGLVNDIVRGTVSADEANVQVTSPLGVVTASVSNRHYLAENVNLQIGENQITITASDAVGNTNSETITVIYKPQSDKKIELVSGQAQTAVIQSNVAQPLIVQLTDQGQPVTGKTVVFRVTEGDGVLQPGSDAEGNGAVVTTNAQGQAQVTYKLGSRAGTGNHKVMARAVGFKGEVLFYQSATFDEGIQMGIIAGNNQRGAVRQPLPQPLVLAVTDGGANLVPNLEVEFEVTRGSGTFNNGETKVQTTTDTDGRASAVFILGPEAGLDQQRITARLIGTEATSGFTASGFVPGDPAQTRISGVVLDNQDRPMENVTIRIEGSTRQAITDEQGQFTVTEAPVGPLHLLIEGSTTTSPGEWPSLSYNIVTVPGVDNPMASPVYLVELDTENAVFVGREDTIVTHPEMPGFAMEVKAGSATFPDGSKEGLISITRVNANKVPMPPPNGMQPQLIVTIQPHGTQFDPPARLTLPNTDAHPPLAEIEMFSFDHDLEEFVTIGLGTVSKDGATVASNVGVGVVKAGWHCGAQPAGSGCCEAPPEEECEYCEDFKGGENCGSGDCELVPDRSAEMQTKGNCQEELCQGTRDDNGDWPEDTEFDCKLDVCEDGKPVDISDPGDHKECHFCDENDQNQQLADDAVCEDGCGTCKDNKCSIDEDKVKPTQTPDNCRTELCGGGWFADNTDIENTFGGCTSCVGGAKLDELDLSACRDEDQVKMDCMLPGCRSGVCSQAGRPGNDPPDQVENDCRIPFCTVSGGIDYSSSGSGTYRADDGRCMACGPLVLEDSCLNDFNDRADEIADMAFDETYETGGCVDQAISYGERDQTMKTERDETILLMIGEKGLPL